MSIVATTLRCRHNLKSNHGANHRLGTLKDSIKQKKEVILNEIELLLILCTATLAVSFYAGCSKIANVIGSFTINIINDSEGEKHLNEEPVAVKKD